MSREQSLILMLDAAAKMQWNIALILEAKAIEAEKVRNWTLNHLNGDSFLTHGDQVGEPLKMHEQLVELLEGLTRMETGLCNNLKAVMVQSDSEDGGGMDGGMFGGMDLGDMGEMSLLQREQEVKLALIESIAHSQQALARILDSIASVSSHSEVSARSLAENIRLLSRYQEEMSRMITGVRLTRIRHGEPGLPWLKDPGCVVRTTGDLQEEC